MTAKLRMRTLVVLMLAGFAITGNASATLEMRNVGANGIELVQGGGVISLQLISPAYCTSMTCRRIAARRPRWSLIRTSPRSPGSNRKCARMPTP